MNLSLSWKWFSGLAGVIAALLLFINLGIDLSLPPYLVDRIRADLQREALLAREILAPQLAAAPAGSAALNQQTHALARQTGLRLTVIAGDGTVIGESDRSPEDLGRIENHLARPEVQQAIRTGFGSATRHSETIGVDLMYVAVTVSRAPAEPVAAETPPNLAPAPRGAADQPLLGFVRVALPLHEIGQTTGRVRRTVAFASLIVGLAAVPFLFWMARRTTQPILEMRAVAAAVARGDFTRRASVRAGREVSDLAEALNNMAAQLAARLRELHQEKADLSAVLANMSEGVLVVDAAGRIRLANNAVRRQFDIGDAALGKTLLEVFRNVALQDLVTTAVARSQPATQELTFLNPAERVFEVNAASLPGGDGHPANAVVVFHNITRLKRLENLRKEFVANVSHELRTPLSIIKGYVETLLDEEPPETATARQFLQTIQKHSRRLEALIADLLSISELESQQARLNLQPLALRPAVEAASDELRERAGAKSMAVSVDLPADLPLVRADAPRLHQVLLNLLDNAIKYTAAGGHITVSARAEAGEVAVCVADTGPGIAPEHLPRIFERFYRADKARSRELGGTGLGLSIVKHIIQAHGGKVWAESELDHGSQFHFTLPHA